jgi:hypothetical protein
MISSGHSAEAGHTGGDRGGDLDADISGEATESLRDATKPRGLLRDRRAAGDLNESLPKGLRTLAVGQRPTAGRPRSVSSASVTIASTPPKAL